MFEGLGLSLLRAFRRYTGVGRLGYATNDADARDHHIQRSLPLAMAKRVAQAMKAEHRTRSELIREALHVYFSTQLISDETPTAAEARAHRRGIAAHKRGDYMTLEAYLDRMDRRPRP